MNSNIYSFGQNNLARHVLLRCLWQNQEDEVLLFVWLAYLSYLHLHFFIGFLKCFDSVVLFGSKRLLLLFDFPISWLWVYMMNSMPESIHTHIISWFTTVLYTNDITYRWRVTNVYILLKFKFVCTYISRLSKKHYLLKRYS